MAGPSPTSVQSEHEHADEAPAATRQGTAAAASLVIGLQRAGGNGAVARLLARELRGDPGNLAPVPASTGVPGNPGTVHAAPSLQDAANHGPNTATAAGVSVAPRAVKPRATESSPIEMDTPAVQDLYEEAAAPAQPEASTNQSSAPDGFSVVDEILGDVTAPMVDEVADNSLFIDPGPTPADVQQGGIGDCWDMATFIGIVNRDPGKITSIMAPDGQGGASVTLHHRVMDPQASRGVVDWLLNNPMPARTFHWEPETVVASKDLAFWRGGPPQPGGDDRAVRQVAGQNYGHRLRGAQLRAAERPKLRRWWCRVVDRRLEIHRVDVFQMARWAPLLEKAAARFSQAHGQYGGGAPPPNAEKRDPNQGYENLQGGFPGFTLGMFYGQAGEYVAGGRGDESATTWNPAMGTGGAALLGANQAAFDRLLGITNAGPGRSPIVTARAHGGDAGDNAYIPRLVAAIGAAQAQVPAPSQAAVTTVLTNANAWVGATADPNPMPPTGPPAGSKSATKQTLITSARAIANDTATHALLLSPSQPAAVTAMVDLLLIIGRMPADTGGRTRSVYSGHEYSVLSADIKMLPGATGHIAAQAPMLRPAFYPFVDVAGSTVKIMNPHHANEPDSNAAGPADGNVDGVFTVGLERFFRLFAAVMSADVPTTPPPSP